MLGSLQILDGDRVLRRVYCFRCHRPMAVIRHPSQMNKTARQLDTADVQLLAIHIGEMADFAEAPTTRAEFDKLTEQKSAECRLS